LPRDAWQQALEGVDAGREVSRLAPADLLFFSDRPDRHVTHVGMALGDSRMAHVALGRGGFALERLDDGRDAFVRSLLDRFLFAKRML
jgi:cell wall-associated NlpC family hydrolase